MHKIILPKRKVLIPAILLPIIFLVIFNFNCDRRSAPKQLNEKAFVQIYCDVVIYADLVDTKHREALVDSVFNSYHISREQFQNTVNAYSRDEKKWEKVFSKIVAELERREKAMKAESDSTKISPDAK